MKVVIIEDEHAASRRLKLMLINLRPDWEIIQVLEGVQESLAWFKTHSPPDLIFTDIQLSDGSAFEIYREITLSCPIIFTTAFDNYAIDAFKLNSVDYLLKPILELNLISAIEKLENLRKKNSERPDLIKLAADFLNAKNPAASRLLIRYGQKLKAVNTKDIAYVFRDGRSTSLTTFTGNTLPVDQSLDELEATLDNRIFFRVNRKMIVQFNSIDDIVIYSKSRLKLKLRPNFKEDILVSSNRSTDFKNWLTGTV